MIAEGLIIFNKIFIKYLSIIVLEMLDQSSCTIQFEKYMRISLSEVIRHPGVIYRGGDNASNDVITGN